MAPIPDLRPATYTYPDTKKQRKVAHKVSVPTEIRNSCHPMPAKWYSLLIPRRDRPSGGVPLPGHDPKGGRDWMLAAHEFGSEWRTACAGYSEPEAAAVLLADLEPLTDPSVAALAWLATHRTVHDVDRSVASAQVVDWWIEANGLEFAIEVYAETCKWRLRQPTPNEKGYHGVELWTYRGFGNHDQVAVHQLDTPFANSHSWQLALRLAHHLVLADAADLTQACQVGQAAGFDRLDASLPTTLDAFDTRSLDTNARSYKRRGHHPAGFALNAVRSVDELFDHLDTTHLDGFGARQVGDPLPTLLDRFGPELVPWLDAAITHGRERGAQFRDSWPASVARDFGTALAWIGTPEAIDLLVKHSADAWIAEAFALIEDTHPDLVIAALAPHVGNEAVRRRYDRLQQVVAGGAANAESDATATDADLPEVLRAPRWLKRQPSPDHVVLPDIEAIHLDEVAHTDRLPEPIPSWMVKRYADLAQSDIDQIAIPLDRSVWDPYPLVAVAKLCSVRRLAEIIEQWDASELSIDVVGPVTQVLLERFEPSLSPALIELAEKRPARSLEPLRAFSSTRLAPTITKLHALTSLRKHTEPWMRLNAEAAALGTLPLLVDPDPKTRASAQAALDVLLDHAPELVEEAAKQYGREMVQAVEQVRSRDPLDDLPKRIPKLPADLGVATLPALRLRHSEAVLPTTATEHLITMLMISPVDAPYAGLAAATEAVDPTDLEKFGWELFMRWSDAGFPSKSKWMFTALAHCGNDDTVARLEPLIRTWPSGRASKRATDGLGILGAIGTDHALTRLYDMSRTLSFKGLKNQAISMIDKIATAKGLTSEELADRTVPDLGLDAAGHISFDYGSQQWAAVLDDQLVPIVLGADGATRTSPPRAKADDDDKLVAEAKKRFNAIKKEAKSIAKDQLGRYETAMVTGRRWPLADFREFLIEHPLSFQLTRRLVWATFGEGDLFVHSFRVAEDRTFADIDDDTIELADDTTVGIVHPIALAGSNDEAIDRWTEVFGDYELLQPFPQLARPMAAPSADQVAQSELSLDTATSEGRVLALRHRGWRYQADSFERRLLGATFRLSLSDYIDMSYIDAKREITLTALHITDTQAQPVRLGDVSPIAASEVLTDLARLAR